MEDLIYTDKEVEAAQKLLAAFLEGMPELGIRPDFPHDQAIVDTCYKGDVHAYIKESFGNFLDQCTEDPADV